ncbi:copper fist DNA binding domain-domain-containing protein [Syncephalastrum racemosum]|uniref:Copper fist DNA binding domain-domain-containing protein n=1 Tax=Syncephalastrum racemosum TaxID=13706 RepID=A0A1X2HMR3_SYNRA|nr:copper fist DNA binding domain-domain-containing protein [Syncephalastrum racemosum]
MVFCDGVKLACLSCIRGHRSSSCNHLDRPLLEVRKKGRPISQCAYCRDLRKTKQIHAKCACTKDMSGATAAATENTGCSSTTQQMHALQDLLTDCDTRLHHHHNTTKSSTIAAAAGGCHARANAATRTKKSKRVKSPTQQQFHSEQLSQQPQQQQQQQQEITFPASVSLVGQDRATIPSTTTCTTSSTSSSITAPAACSSGSGMADDFSVDMFSSFAPLEPLFLDQLTQPEYGCSLPSPCCASTNVDSSSTGESVMVTITPLTTMARMTTTTTRILTCYCGDNCVCPGCLVHPKQQQQQQQQMTTKTSSLYYSSDEDEKCYA